MKNITIQKVSRLLLCPALVCLSAYHDAKPISSSNAGGPIAPQQDNRVSRQHGKTIPVRESSKSRGKGQSSPLPQESTMLSLSSVPGGADILVDGTSFGNAPAVLKLTPGKHVIRMSMNHYKAFSREIVLLSGSSTSLEAFLEKTVPFLALIRGIIILPSLSILALLLCLIKWPLPPDLRQTITDLRQMMLKAKELMPTATNESSSTVPFGELQATLGALAHKLVDSALRTRGLVSFRRQGTAHRALYEIRSIEIDLECYAFVIRKAVAAEMKTSKSPQFINFWKAEAESLDYSVRLSRETIAVLASELGDYRTWSSIAIALAALGVAIGGLIISRLV